MEELKKKKWYQKWWGILLFIIFLIVLSFSLNFGLKFWQEYQNLQAGIPSKSEFSENLELSGVIKIDDEYVIIPTVDDDPSVGPKDAKVKIIIFADFQCPYCQKEFPSLRATMTKYEDRVLFVYRDFAYPPEAHAFAQIAAMAAECADDQGKFWEYHDQIFLNQASLSPENLKVWAAQLGLNMTTFDYCLDQEVHLDEIDKDFQDGQYAKVKGTPTFFVNGHRLQGTPSEEDWSELLDYLLALTTN